jgi:hypothetical protein
MTTIGFFYADSMLKNEKMASKKPVKTKAGAVRDGRI